MIMKKEKTMADAIKYSIQRYQKMGNGSMCQRLYAQLRKLQAVQPCVL